MRIIAIILFILLIVLIFLVNHKEFKENFECIDEKSENIINSVNTINSQAISITNECTPTSVNEYQQEYNRFKSYITSLKKCSEYCKGSYSSDICRCDDSIPVRTGDFIQCSTDDCTMVDNSVYDPNKRSCVCTDSYYSWPSCTMNVTSIPIGKDSKGNKFFQMIIGDSMILQDQSISLNRSIGGNTCLITSRSGTPVIFFTRDDKSIFGINTSNNLPSLCRIYESSGILSLFSKELPPSINSKIVLFNQNNDKNFYICDNSRQQFLTLKNNNRDGGMILSFDKRDLMLSIKFKEFIFSYPTVPNNWQQIKSYGNNFTFIFVDINQNSQELIEYMKNNWDYDQNKCYMVSSESGSPCCWLIDKSCIPVISTVLHYDISSIIDFPYFIYSGKNIIDMSGTDMPTIPDFLNSKYKFAIFSEQNKYTLCYNDYISWNISDTLFNLYKNYGIFDIVSSKNTSYIGKSQDSSFIPDNRQNWLCVIIKDENAKNNAWGPPGPLGLPNWGDDQIFLIGPPNTFDYAFYIPTMDILNYYGGIVRDWQSSMIPKYFCGIINK